MIPKSGYRFSAKIMLIEQAKAKWRFNLKAICFGRSPANPARSAVSMNYSAACVVLRGLCVGRFGALPGGRFDDALICLAVPGDGRLVRRGGAGGGGAGPFRRPWD